MCGFGPPRLGVDDKAKKKKSLFIYFEISRFYHDFLTCWFFYFANYLSITAKLISLLQRQSLKVTKYKV